SGEVQIVFWSPGRLRKTRFSDIGRDSGEDAAFAGAFSGRSEESPSSWPKPLEKDGNEGKGEEDKGNSFARLSGFISIVCGAAACWAIAGAPISSTNASASKRRRRNPRSL